MSTIRRTFRYLAVCAASLCLAVCFAAAGLAFAVTPPALFEADEGPALALRTPQIPWEAVSHGPSYRLEKQAQTGRLIHQKPLRTGQAKADIRRENIPRPPTHQTFRDLPRRTLPAQRFTLRSSEESDVPPLS